MAAFTLTKYRELVQFHENPKVISFWIRLAGPLLRLLKPSKRRLILACGAVWVAFKQPTKDLLEFGALNEATPDVISTMLASLMMFGFLYLCYRTALKFSTLPAFVRNNPQLCLHSLFWLILIVLWSTPADSGLWRLVLFAIAVNLPFFLWRIGYLLMSGKRGKAAGTGFRDHLMYLWPAYGGSNVPYGKGYENLSKNEAIDEEALARAQLAGIRLLLLAAVLKAVLATVDGMFFGADNTVRHAMGELALNLPHVKKMLASGEKVPVGTAWLCMYLELIREVLKHAIGGHQIIGIVRIAGFYVFRNTYKPLLSESIVAFWNRYYYYFKEVMVDFFFFPTFIGWFRKWQKLRLFAAVFMAAFFGNMYYHLIDKSEKLAMGDFFGLWHNLHTRLFYCLLLSIGIFVSMTREQRRSGQQKTNNIFRRVVSIFGVWTFFAVINIWNQGGAASFSEVTRFFIQIIGLT